MVALIIECMYAFMPSDVTGGNSILALRSLDVQGTHVRMRIDVSAGGSLHLETVQSINEIASGA